ncbi:MAG TPA: 2'-5' RNA ligase family protein [Patescibacteria group bacterium]|nr:2'-5' RNA ligase family protein [Patescibacteria group bacterium]
MKNYAIVYFPQINTSAINNYRQKYDPQFSVIAPHITLVFPFSGIPEEQIIKHLQAITETIKPFNVSLKGLMKSFDYYLFLLVNGGSKEIQKVHDKLYSGVLASQLHNHIPFIPHVTLGYFRVKNNQFDSTQYENAYKEAEEMNLNFETILNKFTLIKGNGVSPAEVIKIFDLK